MLDIKYHSDFLLAAQGYEYERSFVEVDSAREMFIVSYKYRHVCLSRELIKR